MALLLTTWAAVQESVPAWPAREGLSLFRTLMAPACVLGLVGLAAWLVRRGRFGLAGRRGPSAIQVETALPLGDRRSLAIVTVEGRRLLVGLTPAQVSLVAELGPSGPDFARALTRAGIAEGGPR